MAMGLNSAGGFEDAGSRPRVEPPITLWSYPRAHMPVRSTPVISQPTFIAPSGANTWPPPSWEGGLSPLSDGRGPGPGGQLVPPDFDSVSTPHWVREPPAEPLEWGNVIESPPIRSDDGTSSDAPAPPDPPA